MDLSNVKNDLSQASIRIQARQLLNMVQEPIAANLAAKIDPGNSDPGMKDKLIMFFSTESGKAIFGILVSMLVETLGLDNETIKAINKEIRIESMAVIGDEVADVVMGPLREVLANFASGKNNNFNFKIGSPSIEEGMKIPTVEFTNTTATVKK